MQRMKGFSYLTEVPELLQELVLDFNTELLALDRDRQTVLVSQLQIRTTHAF